MAFQKIADRYLDGMLALTPVAATTLGDHRFDDRLDDEGPTAREERTDLARKLLADIAALDPSMLSRADQVDAKLLKRELDYTLWRIEELKEWRWNPLIYTTLAGQSLYSLMERDFAPLPVRLINAAARLEALPRFLAQVRESLDPALVPRIHAETAVKQNAGVLTVIDELIEPQLGALPAADQMRLRSAIERARTAISQQQIWLEKRLLPDAKGDFRLGAQRYDAKLNFELASRLSRAEIRTRADAELTKTRTEMYAIARTVLRDRPGAPPLPETPNADQQQAAIEAALQLAYADQPQRSEVIATARQAFEQAERFVRDKDLVTLYPDPLEIIPMPKFRRGVALAYCDAPGPLDTGQKTYFVVAPIPDDWSAAQVRSYLNEYNTRAIHELTIHEAMPGHYVQLEHADRYASPLRAVLRSGAFIEGWAVYAERLMSEQGYRDGDPLMHLIQLKWYLRSIGNAILDQAVHVDGMSRDDALHFMVHDTFQQESEAAAKWERVELTAGQLPTYFVGVQEHLALRDEARNRWGKSFTLKRYHDTVLSFGSPPVRYVRALMFDLPIEE
ncbi:MAG TPA: DUF885 domain-containing protein [Steroidobacteraceae bacterium]|nr:DUF885 domain-containing protein [Steroidobacteraceae bacterium]